MRGTVASAWRRTPRSLELDVRLPANVTATVRVPLLGARRVTATKGAKPLGIENGVAIYTVDSRHWRFATHQ